MGEPSVGIERQSKAEHVLEDEQAGECLDSDFTCED